MRQLIVQVPRGCGQEVLNIASSCGGANIAQIKANNNEEPIDLIIVHISNSKVEELLEKLEDLPNLHITLIPRGVIALQPPSGSAPQQVKDVTERSPIEVFLAGLQSVGSWGGFIAYAAAAGVVVWIGLYTNTIYLLVAAMLIAPFAGPAMNVAIASARGDIQLLQRSLLRYFAALTVTVVVAGILSMIFQQQVTTELMSATSNVSAVAVLLPLTAGAAGALNLVQSERSSLVSGAAVGMLVAASLAPPAGLAGMAGAMGKWDLVSNGVFVLLLQLVGINLSAALVFRCYGLSYRGSRYQRGKKWIFPLSWAVTLVALASLITWQFSTSPELERSSKAQRAIAEIQEVVNSSNLVDLVEANARFTPIDIPGQNTLLCLVYVQRQEGVTVPAEEIRTRISRKIQAQLLQQEFNITPLIDVSILEKPS
jgi:uncharacterized hydrophobic protein (TIGR00271 family)